MSAAHGSVAPSGGDLASADLASADLASADLASAELDAAGSARPLALTGFNPANLISDIVFYDGTP